MKKIVIFIIFTVVVAGIVGVSAFNRNPAEVIGYIDGQEVKTADLQNYVNGFLGKDYEKKLDSAEGRQELFEHYVNRKLLLEYAEKNVDKTDSFVTSHTMGEISEDSAILSALLKKEVNDKVEYTENEVMALVENGQFKDFSSAEREIISKKRVELFHKFMAELRSGREISLAG